MIVGMLVVTALIVICAILLVRHLGASPTRAAVPPQPAGGAPQEILRMRLARGEISEDEYRSRTSALTETI